MFGCSILQMILMVQKNCYTAKYSNHSLPVAMLGTSLNDDHAHLENPSQGIDALNDVQTKSIYLS